MIHTRRIALTVTLAGCALWHNAHALLDYYGYRHTAAYTYVDTDSGRFVHDSTVYFTQQKLGTMQLNISEISITRQGSYLDITEDAWISPNVTILNLPDLTDYYMFKGTLPVPPKAVVTGLVRWQGDKVYRAMLRQTKYNYDQSVTDTMRLMSLFDSRMAMLQQHAESNYELTLAYAALGDRIHVRIRYHLPDNYGGTPRYTVPVLFSTISGSNPKYVRLNFTSDSSSGVMLLEAANGTVRLQGTATYMVPFQWSYAMEAQTEASAAMHVTGFSQAPWAGNYLLFNATVTDSLLKKLSRPIETVFIWRWNSPQAIVTMNQGLKGLSDYGAGIVNQAKLMKDAMRDLQQRGYRCGLVHSVEGSDDPITFASAALTDSSAAQARAYLDQFTEDYLYRTYGSQPSQDPSWVPLDAGENTLSTSRNHFLDVLGRAARLMARSGASYRHAVLLTIGGFAAVEERDLRETCDSLLDSITVDHDNAGYWRGVNVWGCFANKDTIPLTWFSGLRFPAFFPATVSLDLFTDNQPYSFTLKATAGNTLAVTARTAAEWQNNISWTGFDDQGNKTGAHDEEVAPFTAPLDSGLAKIWAGDIDHIAENEEPYPGGTFGILTKATLLQATTADTAYQSGRTVAYLQDGEIFAPRTPVHNRVVKARRTTITVTCVSGVLRIDSPQAIRRIRIFDLSGRLLFVIDGRQLKKSGGGYLLALTGLGWARNFSSVIVEVTGQTITTRSTVNLGGVR